MPTYVDLAVGDSTSFRTADNKQHQVKLLSQSLSRVVVSVDGVKFVFELEQARCGSPGRQLPREISGVLVLPEVVSDLQKAGACKDSTLNRRWSVLSFSWETDDVEANKDDEPGYARLRLFDPARALFEGVFPVEGYKTCTAMLNAVWRPYLVPSSYGFHHGVDISLPRGTPIVAARPGTITKLNNTCKPDEQKSSTCPGCGNWVQVDDGYFIYQYCHLRKHDETLEVGQRVKIGQQLGVSGNTGLSGSPHLHFTIIHKSGIAPTNRKFWTNAFPFMDVWCKQQTCR